MTRPAISRGVWQLPQAPIVVTKAATLDQYFGGRRTAGRGNQYGDATRGRRQTHFRYEAHCLPDRSFSLKKEYQVGRGLASLRPV
jgi:hypothetical protein